MSYDLMVFDPEIAPRSRVEFMKWYEEQTQWAEGHSYDDPVVSSKALSGWFVEMIKTFPAMNGPFAIDDPAEDDTGLVTDYSIGRNVIYACFSWSAAEQAYPLMKILAEKHQIGFFDASASDGDILFPDGQGNNLPIDNSGTASSIEQIMSMAEPQDRNVRDVIYRKTVQKITEAKGNGADGSRTAKPKRKWWQRLFK